MADSSAFAKPQIPIMKQLKGQLAISFTWTRTNGGDINPEHVDALKNHALDTAFIGASRGQKKGTLAYDQRSASYTGNWDSGVLQVRPDLPKALTPINLKAYLYNVFGVCGCNDIEEILRVLKDLLVWHDTKANQHERPGYATLFNGDAGVFYIMAGLLDRLDLTEHGSSSRYGWLTDDGERLLYALNEHSTEAIDAAGGEAYDGCYYQGDEA